MKAWKMILKIKTLEEEEPRDFLKKPNLDHLHSKLPVTLSPPLVTDLSLIVQVVALIAKI